MKIFISSPCYDLIDTRAEIKAMIDEMGLEGILSEDPTCSFDIAPNQNSIETCLTNVRQSDVLLVILSQRCGPTLEVIGHPKKTATILEYEEAIKNKKPIYFYVRDKLYAEFDIWRRNTGVEIKCPWAREANSHGLFDFIKNRVDLDPGGKNNWVTTFRTSVDLSEIVRHDLKLSASSDILRKLIIENKLPVIDLDCKNRRIIGNRMEGHALACTFSLINVGMSPSFSSIAKLTSNSETGAFTAPAPITFNHSYEFSVLNPLVYGRFEKLTYDITYISADGFSILDKWEVNFNRTGNGDEFAVRVHQISREYKVGIPPEIKISK